MNSIQIISTQLNQAFKDKSWHGTNLRGSIRGLSLEQALYRPNPDRHNIWEQVLHCAYWKYVVWRRITGASKSSFPRQGSDWPTPSGSDSKAWKKDVKLLADQHQQLLDLMENLKEADLSSFPEKSKTSVLDLLIGVAAHDLYHCGQIQMLKRLFQQQDLSG